MRRWVNWRLMKLVIDLGWSLKGADKHVALVLASHAGDDGRDAFPSLAVLARECGLGRTTVWRALGRLTQTPYVRVQAPATQHRPTTYAFVLSELVKVRPIQRVQSDDAEDVQIEHAEDPAQRVQSETQRVHPEGSACSSRGFNLKPEENRSGKEQGTQQEQVRAARDVRSAEERQAAELRFQEQAHVALQEAYKADDWRGECLRMHGGSCGLSQRRHATRKQLDQARRERVG